MKFVRLMLIYIVFKGLIIGSYYGLISGLEFVPVYDEGYTRNKEFSPIWNMHLSSNWACVDTDKADMYDFYIDGNCTIEIGENRTIYVIGDSHAGHLRGALDELITRQTANIFLTYRYSCPFISNTDTPCKTFYKNAIDYIKQHLSPGDLVILSYFYRPSLGIWSDFNAPATHKSWGEKTAIMTDMIYSSSKLANELEAMGASFTWLLNGPSPDVAPFILKDQGNWPKFKDSRIGEVNQKIINSSPKTLQIVDLARVWNQIQSTTASPCQRLGERDNHHISYRYSQKIAPYLVDYNKNSPMISTKGVFQTDTFNAKC